MSLKALYGSLHQVKATPIPGKRADHQGIRVQLIGQIELASERGHPHDFVSLGELGGQLPHAPRHRGWHQDSAQHSSA